MSCFKIKKKFTFKKSGYYWIKPECVEIPLRVFCDFENYSYGKDIAYYGNTKGSERQIVVKNKDDAVNLCSLLGLEYYQFNEKVDNFITVKLYLNDIGVDFGKDLMVPLFFDYKC